MVRPSPALAVSLLAVCLGACGSDDPVVPALDFSQVDATIESYLADNELEGATLVIVHRDYGIVHLRGFGGFDTHRISLIASSSKIISAGVLMRLHERGRLDMDAPVSSFVPEYWGLYKEDITPAQLVSNSSGMVGLIDNPLYGKYLCQYIAVGSLEVCARTIYTADDAADRVPPDTMFRYGGGQWQLAGGIAEYAGGKSWNELVEETYRPCRLNVLGYTNQFQRSFAGTAESSLGYPEWFDGDVADLPVTTNPSIEGGAYTTAEDYGKILLMHLRGGRCQGGRALSEASVLRMREDRIGTVYGGETLDPAQPGYGFGWWVSRDGSGIVSDGGAYGAAPWLDTVRGYGVMIILETEAGSGYELRTAVTPLVAAAFDAALAE